MSANITDWRHEFEDFVQRSGGATLGEIKAHNGDLTEFMRLRIVAKWCRRRTKYGELYWEIVGHQIACDEGSGNEGAEKDKALAEEIGALDDSCRVECVTPARRSL